LGVFLLVHSYVSWFCGHSSSQIYCLWNDFTVQYTNWVAATTQQWEAVILVLFENLYFSISKVGFLQEMLPMTLAVYLLLHQVDVHILFNAFHYFSSPIYFREQLFLWSSEAEALDMSNMLLRSNMLLISSALHHAQKPVDSCLCISREMFPSF